MHRGRRPPPGPSAPRRSFSATFWPSQDNIPVTLTHSAFKQTRAEPGHSLRPWSPDRLPVLASLPKPAPFSVAVPLLRKENGKEGVKTALSVHVPVGLQFSQHGEPFVADEDGREDGLERYEIATVVATEVSAGTEKRGNCPVSTTFLAD